MAKMHCKERRGVRDHPKTLPMAARPRPETSEPESPPMLNP